MSRGFNISNRKAPELSRALRREAGISKRRFLAIPSKI